MNLDAKDYLLIALGAITIFYIIVLARGIMLARQEASRKADARVSPALVGTGFVTNFFDTLGIGSFATTTAIFRWLKMVRDEHIPGTLNVGHTLPTIAQAFIFTTVVPVDSKTLILMIVAAVLGAWLGAGVVSGWPRRRVQLGMGFALVTAAVILVLRTLNAVPAGSDALGLTGTPLLIGIAGNFVLGALMTLGIGLYAPCMILVSMLGLNATTAFPIMMGSCAFLMPVASSKFVKEKAFNPGAALGLLIGGIPAALIAGLIVKELPLDVVKWLVVVVVLYAAYGLITTALRERKIDADRTTKGGATP